MDTLMAVASVVGIGLGLMSGTIFALAWFKDANRGR